MQIVSKEKQFDDYLRSGGKLDVEQWQSAGLFDWALAGEPNPALKRAKHLSITEVSVDTSYVSKNILPGTIYICGPVTGLPLNNFPAFQEAEEELTKLGAKCLNPHSLFENLVTKHYEHDDYMRVCISALALCDSVVTLNGWEQSKGADMEVKIARLMNKEVVPLHKFIALQNGSRN